MTHPLHRHSMQGEAQRSRDMETSLGRRTCGTKAGFQLAHTLRFGLAGMTI